MRAELKVLVRGPVLAALLLTVVSSSAMFTVFTYIAPILQVETGAASSFVTFMLVVYGLGLALGNWLGGRFADRSLDGTLIGSLAAVVVLLVLFMPGMRSQVAVVPLVFLWGIASFALVPPLQMRVVSEAAQAPNLASAMNIGAFNLGNALGAALGGAVIDIGLGYPAVCLAGRGPPCRPRLRFAAPTRPPADRGCGDVQLKVIRRIVSAGMRAGLEPARANERQCSVRPPSC